jgi:ribosome-binding factor A
LQVETAQRFPRSARVNEVLREVLAETLERLADKDERLALLTITAVTSDPDLRRARVMFASLSEEARAGLEVSRLRLQSVIAEQVRLKRTPQLSFTVDPAVATGERVEEILRQIRGTGAGLEERKGPDDQ